MDGSRFPIIMKQLYAGCVQKSDAATALSEMHVIRRELAQLPPVKSSGRSMIAPSARHGEAIAPDIESLATHFVTARGRDLIALLTELFELQDGEDDVARIVNY